MVVTASPMCGAPSKTSGEYIVDVFAPPSVSLTASDTKICGSPVTLTATVTGPLAKYQIGFFRNGVAFSWVYAKTYTKSIFEGGNYYVQAWDTTSGCRVYSESFAITYSAKPNPNGWLIDGSSSLCPGISTRLYVVNPNPTSTYVWTNGMVGSSIVVTEPGTYNVTETNEYGCSGLSSIARTLSTRTPPPIPTITPSADTTICEGESITRTSSLATTYLWSNGATTRSITVNQAGSYTVTAFDFYGCQSSSSLPVGVTVSPIPLATIAPDGPATFCAGGAVVLTASTGTSYLWSNGATTPAISATQAGSYSVTVTLHPWARATSGRTARPRRRSRRRSRGITA